MSNCKHSQPEDITPAFDTPLHWCPKCGAYTSFTWEDNWTLPASTYIDFADRQPQDGQECIIRWRQVVNSACEFRKFKAAASYIANNNQGVDDERCFNIGIYAPEYLYPSAEWIVDVLWQPLPSPPTPEEVERAKGEAK